MKTTICENCRFFDTKIRDAELHALGFGFCHLEPPIMHFPKKGYPVAILPRVVDCNWCSYWQGGSNE